MADRKNGRTLFDRPKPTVGCSANGRRLNIYIYMRFYFGVKVMYSNAWEWSVQSKHLAFIK